MEKLLVEKEKSYHVWGKVLSGETIHDFWLPKGALIKTHTIKDVVVDYEKYSNRPPLEHQKLAIEKLAGSKRFILADDMGLGKTLQAIVAITQYRQKKKGLTLIVCPTSLLYNWKEEVMKFNPLIRVGIIDGLPQQRKKTIEDMNTFDILITSTIKIKII